MVEVLVRLENPAVCSDCLATLGARVLLDVLSDFTYGIGSKWNSSSTDVTRRKLAGTVHRHFCDVARDARLGVQTWRQFSIVNVERWRDLRN